VYYLGSITAASGAYYNDRTGVSGIGAFTIPPSIKALYLAYGGSGLTGLSFLLSTATGVTSFITAANGAPVPAVGTIGGPYPTVHSVGGNIKVGVYNPNGGFISVRVFAAPTS
jgi:hypothetical protein